MNALHLSWHLCYSVAKVNVEHYSQASRPNSFVLAKVIITYDLYHFVSFLLALTMAKGHKVSRKQNRFGEVTFLCFCCLLYFQESVFILWEEKNKMYESFYYVERRGQKECTLEA